MRLTAEQIDKAVNWWAKQLGSPTFKTLSNEERSDPSTAPAAIAEGMAMMLAKDITYEQGEVFKTALRESLTGRDVMRWELSVDYSPTNTLGDAAQKAGIPLTNFPWKTNMSFGDDGSVKVALGYRSPYEQI